MLSHSHTHNMYILIIFLLYFLIVVVVPPYSLLIRHIWESIFETKKEMPTRPFNVKFMEIDERKRLFFQFLSITIGKCFIALTNCTTNLVKWSIVFAVKEIRKCKEKSFMRRNKRENDYRYILEQARFVNDSIRC